MSIHKSLRIGFGQGGSRNVMTRWERVQKLREQGRWSDESTAYGLPKVRTVKIKVGGKKKKAKDEEKDDKKGKK